MGRENILGGPVTFRYYKIKYKNIHKNILLLGDIHTKYSSTSNLNKTEKKNVIELCPFIVKIINAAAKKNICIDLFLEYIVFQKQYIYPLSTFSQIGGNTSIKKLQTYSSPLNAVRDCFWNCHSVKQLPREPNCPYNNLRVQNWDLRVRMRGLSPILGNWTDNIVNKILWHGDQQKFKKFTNKQLIKYIIGVGKKTDKKRIEKEILKQVDDMKGVPGIGGIKSHTSLSFPKHKQRHIKKQFDKMMKKVTFPKNFLNTFLKAYSNQPNIRDVGFTSTFTDYYMISRMFSHFKKDFCWYLLLRRMFLSLRKNLSTGIISNSKVLLYT